MMIRTLGRCSGSGAPKTGASGTSGAPTASCRKVLRVVFISCRLHFVSDPSKVEPQCELHRPWTTRCSNLTEAGVHLSSGWIELSGGVDRGKLGMVEHIISFAAELESGPLVDHEVLEQGRVPVIDAWAANFGFRRISCAADGWEGERAGV